MNDSSKGLDLKKVIEINYPNNTGFYSWHSDVQIGTNTLKAFKNVKKKIKHNESADAQLAKAIEIISMCNPPYVQKGVKKTGLVIGRVQSGKTTSFTLVSALAADNGYKLIIHLLGTANNLLESNYGDVVRVLGIEDGTPTNWNIREVKATGKGGIDLDPQSLTNLVSGNPASMQSKNSNKIIYLPLLKNKHSILPLTDLLRQAKIIKDIPILIIDDEVDSHGMNIKRQGSKNKYNQAIEGSQSATNKHLHDLRDACGTVTYLGYTATAQGPILQHPNNFMSANFHTLLEPGKGYIGNKELFGKPKRIKAMNAYRNHKDWNHQIKEIDVACFDPVTGKEVDDIKKLRESIFDSVCNFLVSYVLLRKRQMGDPSHPNDNPISMMIHTTARTGAQGNRPNEINHQEVVSLLKDYLENNLFSGLSSGKNNVDYKRVKNTYDEKMQNLDKTFNNQVMPDFETVLEKIKQFVDPNIDNIYQIKEVNARTTAKIEKVEWGNAEMWFLVGGVGLSRGYVVEGLLTSFMSNEPKDLVADTMEQRGRFFGYKKSYLDLISIYIKEKTMESFRDYILHEEQLWSELERSWLLGESIQGSDPYFISSNAISKLTSQLKVRRPITTLNKDWVTCKTLPFITNSNECERCEDFYYLTQSFINKLNLKKPKINPWNANLSGRASGQDFTFARCDLDKVVELYLNKVISLDEHENDLNQIIKYLKKQFLGQKNVCDVVLFNQDKRQLTYNDVVPGLWAWPGYGYRSGGRKGIRNMDPSKDYCGDDRVILGENFDPFLDPCDEDNNYNTTLQIHHFNKVYYEDPDTGQDLNLCSSNDIYAIRIKTQHSKTKIIQA